jgi:NAD(P)-dependent dehydrogenase (short-subunit alcohol dehydrogenase family)
MNDLLQDKLALVTGSGRGLGAAIAKGFAHHGARVVICDLDFRAAEDQAQALCNAGFQAYGYGLDVTDRSAVNAFAAQVQVDHGAIDILVNNAGVAGRATFDEPHAPDVWDKIIKVNLEGTFNVSHAFVPALKVSKGAVVNLCSVAGFVSGASTAGYVASKGAVRSLTQVMARDLAAFGIRVNAVAPGIMMSEMATAQLSRPGGADWFMNRVMMKRIGETAEIVEPVVFLASSMASYITGTILPIDGGFLAA